jgi:hypothetical protein
MTLYDAGVVSDMYRTKLSPMENSKIFTCWFIDTVQYRFVIFSRLRKISKSDYYLRHVFPSVRME